MRPLDRVRSIKAKLVIVIVAAVAISALVSTIGWRTGIPLALRPVIAVGLSLLLVYPFSRGITSPLRQMAGASKAMSDGDFSHPVSVSSRDEVGDLARAFDQMRAQLAEVDRQQRALIANVAHELRTPLTVLRARFENIADGVEPNDGVGVTATLAEIERLSLLVERVLDLSRLESGASPLHVESFDVADLVAEATDGALVAERAADIEIEVHAPTDFTGDRARIHQVVRNLVDNALRHGCDPCVVSARVTDQGLSLTVSDHGPGIPESDRDRVFERFSRAEDARSPDRGVGLGLAIVTEIVELHRGSIQIVGNDPTGCRVVVDLPQSQRSVP